MIDSAASANPHVRELLRKHPEVASVTESENPGLDFTLNGWNRAVSFDQGSGALLGIAELVDNNPLVCADVMVLPNAGETLALIALGPLISAGLLVETPTVLSNVAIEDLDPFLKTLGWEDGVLVSHQEVDLDGVVGVTVMAAIRTPEDLDDLDALYEERYGRSLLVRLADSGEWDTQLVKGQPYAAYRLRINPDEPNSLLTIRVMADENGKAGAAQVVHAMNVMCGLPESLGLF